MDILNVLEKATQINSVSGSENEIRKFISDNVKKYCDELSVRGTYGRDWYNCNRY